MRTQSLSILLILALLLPARLMAGDSGPMQPIMQAMGENMARIAAGIWREDYDEVGAGAVLIAEHPLPPLLERLSLLSQLGSEAPHFMAADEDLKSAALALEKVARTKKLDAVMRQYHLLQQQCVACHRWYRLHIKQAASKPWEEM